MRISNSSHPTPARCFPHGNLWTSQLYRHAISSWPKASSCGINGWDSQLQELASCQSPLQLPTLGNYPIRYPMLFYRFWHYPTQATKKTYFVILMTLTFDLWLPNTKNQQFPININVHAKNQGCRSSGLSCRVGGPTDRQTNGTLGKVPLWIVIFMSLHVMILHTLFHLQSGMLLEWVTSLCTSPSGYLHLSKWLSVTWPSALTNWPLDPVCQISDFGERHLCKCHGVALSQVITHTNLDCQHRLVHHLGGCQQGTYKGSP